MANGNSITRLGLGWIGVFFVQLHYCVMLCLRMPYYFVKAVLLRQDTIWGQRLLTRWGFLPQGLLDTVRGRDVIWIDAFSGGEVTQIVTFCQRLKAQLADYTIILSTNNDYAARFARQNVHGLDYVFDTPWDIGFVCRKVLTKIRPVALVFVENVYFPILAKCAQRKRVKTVLVSGLVNLAFKGHPIYRRAFRLRFHRYVKLFAVKSRQDHATLVDNLGVPPDAVETGGNLKFDLDWLHVSKETETQLRSSLGLVENDRFVLVAGSTHEGEAKLILRAVDQLQMRGLRIRLLIAPRYAHTINEVIEEAEEMGLASILRSAIKPGSQLGEDVVVIDTFGELSRMYSVADAVILGGTFFRRWKVGFGQNIIEPLACLKPILFGPFVSQFRDITERLKATWPELEVRTADDLTQSIACLMTDKAVYQNILRTEKEILEENRGNVDRHVRLLIGHLKR